MAVVPGKVCHRPVMPGRTAGFALDAARTASLRRGAGRRKEHVTAKNVEELGARRSSLTKRAPIPGAVLVAILNMTELPALASASLTSASSKGPLHNFPRQRAWCGT